MSVADILKFLLAISVLPSAILMWLVYRKDKIEKEPMGLLAILFFVGGFSIIPAGIAESLFQKFMQGFIELDASMLGNFIKAFLVVALIEEGVKFLILRFTTWKNKNFNYMFDAIVYAVFVSLGFAAFENILYVFSNGIIGGIITAIIRAVVSIPGHMTFGVLMGIYYGRSKLCALRGDTNGAAWNMMLSLGVPILLHGLFDFCLFEHSSFLLLLFFVLVFGLYITLFRSINKYSAGDHQLRVKNEESDEWILADEYDSSLDDENVDAILEKYGSGFDDEQF